MAYRANYSSTPSDSGVLGTANGVSLFAAGEFYVQYSGFAAIASSTAETSILFAQASATANTLIKPATGTVQMSGDPSGKGPGSSLYLPGTRGQILQLGGQGGLTIGTIIRGEFNGVFGITGTPDITTKLVLRNPTTGAVAYTLATTAFTTTVAGAIIVRPRFCVTANSTPTAGTIVGFVEVTGPVTGAIATATSTTVDLTQSYIIDVTHTWSADSASNTMLYYFGNIGLVG
jgi:hypothetical protein